MPQGKYFVLRNQINGLVLHIKEDSLAPNNPVVSWRQEADSDQQLWYLDAGSGTIRTKLNSYCLDLEEDKTVINPYEPRNSNQQWEVSEGRIVNHDLPTLVVGLPPGEVMPGAQAMATDDTALEEQRWTIEYLPARYFFIRSKMHKKVLDIAKGKLIAGTKVVLWPEKKQFSKDGRDNQLWYEDENGIIRAKANEFALDASAGSITIRPYDPSNPKQQWIIAGDVIRNRVNFNEVIDIKGESKMDDARIVGFKFHGKINQRWTIDYI